MLADAFDNLRLFGKQEFWLVLAGSDRFEVGRFAFVIKNRFEKGRNGLPHFLSGGAVIGSEQRIKESFEFVLVELRESIHPIRAEIVVHRAGEEDRKFAEQVGVVLRPSTRKAK